MSKSKKRKKQGAQGKGNSANKRLPRIISIYQAKILLKEQGYVPYPPFSEYAERNVSS